MGPTWDLSVPAGPMLAPWALLSGSLHIYFQRMIIFCWTFLSPSLSLLQNLSGLDHWKAALLDQKTIWQTIYELVISISSRCLEEILVILGNYYRLRAQFCTCPDSYTAKTYVKNHDLIVSLELKLEWKFNIWNKVCQELSSYTLCKIGPMWSIHYTQHETSWCTSQPASYFFQIQSRF